MISNRELINRIFWTLVYIGGIAAIGVMVYGVVINFLHG